MPWGRKTTKSIVIPNFSIPQLARYQSNEPRKQDISQLWKTKRTNQYLEKKRKIMDDHN